MKNIQLGTSTIQTSEIALGCMRIASMEEKAVTSLIETALASGIRFFEHADIYGDGGSETIFGKAYHGKREDIVIQTKCGIKKGLYDFSKEHILQSVDNSLKRLKTDYVDFLLLHRPDALVEPEEVAEAFDILQTQQKVRFFGVSNHNPMQILLLKKYVKQPICVNQLQFGLAHTPIVDAGLNMNTYGDAAIHREGSVLDFCRLEDITIQAWSPFLYGMFEGVFLTSEKYAELNRQIALLAEKYNCTPEAIAMAWILRHPAKIQPIAGTTNETRLKNICEASNIILSREEWYQLYVAAGNQLP